MTGVTHDTPQHMEADTHNYDPIREELLNEGLDLPELASTMEDAEARLMATRLLKVLGSLRGESDANAAEYNITKDFLLNRHVERENVLEGQINYVIGKLRYLFDTFMDLPHGKQSLNLLGGRIGTKKQQPELVVESDEDVITWAAENDVPVYRTKHEVSRPALRKYLQEKKATEIDPPGTQLRERDPKFYATPATD